MTTLHYKDYEGSIETSLEGRCFYGQILFVNDLVTYEGESFETLENAFHDAVDDYLAFCAEVGKAPDKPFKGVFNVRVRPEIHRALAGRAVHTNQSLNELVSKALETYLTETQVHHTHHHVHEHVLNEQHKRMEWATVVSASIFETAVETTSVLEDIDLTDRTRGTFWTTSKTQNYGRC
ncbi:type II toxin-antitoxin system HicB family antitoxin [Thiobacillus sp.]|jgi:predicted HicB family RNase H-like nuclease|uniref:type II toxin-antitoxin system HicB family antitoxin n=1 Tax=Thiobacillus sp. TaxID=924 RepID=UPI0025E45A0B|nr:type II toxin-antitoxin system HicB family antitoxin [Thiobacillus sp.]